jgi:Fe(3+) dicitrate transport protein
MKEKMKRTVVLLINAMFLAFSAVTTGYAQENKGSELSEVVVVGDLNNLSKIPGSGQVLDKESLESARAFTVNEALRKLPGVNVRDEEGFGLRPNIGLRGLNPTRSTKVTLLQDGVPAAYAPYGDNASYYHPPIDRFERIEVLKGAGQIAFGPQTIGGVINYITPTPPQEFDGFLSLSGGNRNYFDGKLQLGGKGLLFDYTRKQGDGARDNIDSKLNDVNLKGTTSYGENQAFTYNLNAYTEDSTITYSGLTEAELKNFGVRYNPFKNDEFEGRRYASSIIHSIAFDDSTLTTSVYYSYFDRDWWRQSSTTTDTQGGAAGTALMNARLAGQAIDVDAHPSIQGRLRDYTTVGIEPRLSVPHNLFGIENEMNMGVKAHFEKQDRKQVNGTSSKARSGTLAEKNLRETDAYSTFFMNRFSFDQWSLTPGVRYEYIDALRKNRLKGVTGSDSLDQWVPGIGATWNPKDAVTLFAGVHKGFAPPRTEDIIAGTGTSTDVESEESTNLELGFRTRAEKNHLEATFFRNDFDRLIAVGSIAGGSTPLAQGEALFQGVELSGRYGIESGLYLRGAYTFLDEAEQSTAFKEVVGGKTVTGSKAGNQQPYAPEHLLTAGLGFERGGLDASVESVFVDEQFANFSNTRDTSVNGQSGTIPSHTIWNATINYEVKAWQTTFFVTGKNLFDKEYIVDRTRGIQVGNPQLIQVGIKYALGKG